MADEKEKDGDEKGAAAKPSALPKIMIAGFVAVVVVVETFLFFFLVPTADDVAALAEARLVSRLEEDMKADGEEVIDESENIEEFNMGEFSVQATPPGATRKYRIDFRLFGTVKNKDLSRLEALYREHEGRFRNALMFDMRKATYEELTEDNLGLIQRRILATSNEIMGEPVLLGIGFNDFQLFEE